MNKKGIANMIYGLMLFAMVFIFGALIVTGGLSDIVEEARDPAHLDCDNSSISTGHTLGCIVIDLSIPLFLITLIGGALGLVVIEGKTGV